MSTENRSAHNHLGLLFATPLLCLVTILTAREIYHSQIERQWIWPLINGWNSPPGTEIALAAMFGGALILLLVISYRSCGFSSVWNWSLSTSVPLLFFCGLWIILPVSGSGAGTWLLVAALLACAIYLSVGSLQWLPAPQHRYFFAHGDLLADSLIILSPIVVGAWLAGGPGGLDAQFGALHSAGTYPVYALVQLWIFLWIPATQLTRQGYSPRAIAISCAVIFSIAHWPNPALMAATGLAMLVWARQFLRGRNILILALVMGVAATGFRFAMPEQWAWEMRIGPDYMEKRAAAESSLEAAGRK